MIPHGNLCACTKDLPATEAEPVRLRLLVIVLVGVIDVHEVDGVAVIATSFWMSLK